MSARIRVADFVPNKSQKRVARKNAYLERNARSPWATEDQFLLFQNYLQSRHSDGGMADMDVFEFAAMIEETPIRSRVVEYTTPDDTPDVDTGLTAVCLTDVFDDGVSMVYSFYNPDLARNSLGTYIILDHIEIARAAGLPYVYLGYWVPNSPKMGYKARFSALEVYKNGEWLDVLDPDDFNEDDGPDFNDQLADQVAQINLPDTRITAAPVILKD